MVNVSLIRAFEGPRHSTLEFLWDVVAEWAQRDIRLIIHPNPGARKSHAQCLEELWLEELGRPERQALITEFDFLPELRGGDWLDPCELTEGHPIVAANYAVRDPRTLKLKEIDNVAGAWYMLIDKTQVGLLDFSPCGKYNDPANGLVECVQNKYGKNLFLLTQRDAAPRHYGTEMITGTHLFWSRHLHDDPMSHVAGVHLGDMQRRHDLAVRDWLRSAPRSFQRLAAKRATKLAAAALGCDAVGTCPSPTAS